MAGKMKRRRFIKIGAAAAAGVPVGLTATNHFQKPVAKSDVIRLGIIGTGDRGTWEAYILKVTPGIDVVACCDILPDHLEDGLKEAVSGARGYKDYRNLLEDKNIDAVLIATPQNLHYQMVIDALAAGKDIICEKTMTFNTEEAMKLSRAVKQSDRVFQVGYQWQSSPLFQKIRKMVQDGECGQVTHIRCNYNRNTNWRRKVSDPSLERLINWRMYRSTSGGLMAELCSHHINITNWVLDKVPEKIMGFGGIDYWKDGRETFDNVNTIFQYPGGIKASFQAVTSNAFEGVSVLIMGDAGTIHITNEEGQVAHFYSEPRKVKEELNDPELKTVDGLTSATLKAWARSEAIPITVENNTKDDLETTRAMFLDFAEGVKNRKMPVSSIDNGRNVAIAVDLALNAMYSGEIQFWKPEYSM